jgi:transposase
LLVAHWRPSQDRQRADPWLTELLQRKPARLATVAMADKTARIMWAVLIKDRPYEPRAVPASAA